MPTALEPGLVTGTSTEYLGSRPLRRVLRDRSVVVVSGPPGVGKSTVADRVACGNASVDPGGAQTGAVQRVVGTRIHDVLVRRVRQGRWPEALLQPSPLVLDGLEFLMDRLEPARMVVDLARSRARRGGRTVLVAQRDDGTAHAVLGLFDAGEAAHLILRFPNGPAGRRRFAQRQADLLGLDKRDAAGTEGLEPWDYAAVNTELERRLRQRLIENFVAPRLPFLEPAARPVTEDHAPETSADAPAARSSTDG